MALGPVAKLFLILLFFLVSYGGFQLTEQLHFLGYVSLFLALGVIFEGFGLQLVWKILIALALGLGISLLPIFNPGDLVAMKPVGSKIFMNLLTMALVPLVFSSILTGVTSLADINKLNRIGAKTLFYYICTTAIAIIIGLLVANLFQPGKSLPIEVRQKMEADYKDTATSKIAKAESNKKSLFETVQGIVPKNIVHTISGPKPEMLALIFFAVISGLALLQIEAKKAAPVIAFFEGITEMTIKIIIMAMRIAPYGVFALIAATVAQTQSLDLLMALLPFSAAVLLGLAIHAFGTNTLSFIFLSKRPVAKTFNQMWDVAVTAFSTASSGATLPVTMTTAEKKMGIKKEVSGFVLPLGATVNMDGTALFQGVSAIFLANIYGIDLDLTGQLTVIGMAVMASIGTAAVPGVGVVVLTMILVSVGIPPEGILFILPVNNILDMFRTSVNVMGDLTCACFVNHGEEISS